MAPDLTLPKKTIYKFNDRIFFFQFQPFMCLLCFLSRYLCVCICKQRRTLPTLTWNLEDSSTEGIKRCPKLLVALDFWFLRNSTTSTIKVRFDKKNVFDDLTVTRIFFNKSIFFLLEYMCSLSTRFNSWVCSQQAGFLFQLCHFLFLRVHSAL